MRLIGSSAIWQDPETAHESDDFEIGAFQVQPESIIEDVQRLMILMFSGLLLKGLNADMLDGCHCQDIKDYADAAVAAADHGALSGLADDDHTLYAKGDPDSSSTTGNLASFLNTDGRSLEDSGIAANNVTLNSDNLSNLENAADARANIGLGDRATQDDGDDVDAADVVYDGEMHVAGVSTPTISANTNNLNADGVGFLRANVSALGSVDLTGIVAPSPAVNRLLYIQNVGGNPLVLKNQDANSSAANRFLLPGGVDLTLAGNGIGAILLYDTASSRWRCVGHTN